MLQVKKRQQRVLMILDSKNIPYEVIDITEPGKESEKEFMQEKSTSKGSTASDHDPRHPLPPQIFADDEYCGECEMRHFSRAIQYVSLLSLPLWGGISSTGSYDEFEMSNETDALEQFLKMAPPAPEPDAAKNEVCADN